MASVLHICVTEAVAPMNHLREHLNRLLLRLNQLRDQHPREVRAAIRGTAVLAIVCVVAVGWFLLSLSRSLPSAESLARMGEMDQATAVYDASDSLVFTIFKEQRIDVPLESMSPYLVKALVAIEDQRFYDHHGFDLIRIVSAALPNVRHRRPRPGRQHDHAAAGAAELSDARQDLPPEDSGSSSSPGGSSARSRKTGSSSSI